MNIDFTHDQIARRAYVIYEREGRVPGHDVENWLRAEAELQRELWLREVSVKAEPKTPRLKNAPAFPGVAKLALRNRRKNVSSSSARTELNRAAMATV